MITCFQFSHHDDYRAELHSHPEGQFFMLLQGAVTFLTAEGERLMTAGRPCWVPPAVAHGVKSRGDMAGITFHVDPPIADALPDCIAIFKPNPFIDILAEKMLAVSDQPARLAALWHVMSDELCVAEQDALYLPSPQDKKLRKLTDWLAQHPADARGLADWAAEINMAPRTLVRKFRAETAMSFIEWRQRARVMQAISLLSAGASVTDTSLSVGYDSLSAFISVFKQITGVAPMQYQPVASAK